MEERVPADFSLTLLSPNVCHPLNLNLSSRQNPSQESQNTLVNLGLICSNEVLLFLSFWGNIKH